MQAPSIGARERAALRPSDARSADLGAVLDRPPGSGRVLSRCAPRRRHGALAAPQHQEAPCSRSLAGTASSAVTLTLLRYAPPSAIARLAADLLATIPAAGHQVGDRRQPAGSGDRCIGAAAPRRAAAASVRASSARRSPWPNSAWLAATTRAQLVGAVHQRGHAPRPARAARSPGRRPLARSPAPAPRSPPRPEREHPQQAASLRVGPVEPELVERVRARQVRASARSCRPRSCRTWSRPAW